MKFLKFCGPQIFIKQPINVRERFQSDGTKIDSGEIELKPLGNTQINQVFKDKKPIEAAYIDVWTETPNGKFVVYGMVIDNKSNDGFISEPQW